MDTNTPRLDGQLCFSIYSTSLAITQVYKKLLAPHGLTYPQYLIMLILWEEDGISLNTICKHLGQQPGALTPVLKRMEEDGFVKRTRSVTDERQLEIYLTRQGRNLKAKAAEIQACVVEASGLTMDDAVRIKAVMDGIRTNLQGSALSK